MPKSTYASTYAFDSTYDFQLADDVSFAWENIYRPSPRPIRSYHKFFVIKIIERV